MQLSKCQIKIMRIHFFRFVCFYFCFYFCFSFRFCFCLVLLLMRMLCRTQAKFFKDQRCTKEVFSVGAANVDVDAKKLKSLKNAASRYKL
jgi:hypothetical protein